MFLVTFLMTDVIGEVCKENGLSCGLDGVFQQSWLWQYGPGNVCNTGTVLQGQQAFAVIGAAPRLVLASLMTYLISQSHDVWAFTFGNKRQRETSMV